jgi:hypothetical protein
MRHCLFSVWTTTPSHLRDWRRIVYEVQGSRVGGFQFEAPTANGVEHARPAMIRKRNLNNLGLKFEIYKSRSASDVRGSIQNINGMLDRARRFLADFGHARATGRH